MKQKLLSILLTLLLPISAIAEDHFKYLGAYDNVKSGEASHCYGISVLVWKLDDKHTIGLLNVDMGLCGDPPCSMLEGTIDGDKLTFKTSVPIYDELYSFNGNITKTGLSGLLNGVNTTLNANSFELSYKNTKEWCSTWSQVPSCSGVKEYCQ